MNRPAKAQEPSMDEILASIRRIIADDDAAKAQTGHASPAPSAPGPQSSAPATAPRSGAMASSGLRPPFSVRPTTTSPGGSLQEFAPRPEDDSLSGSTRFESDTGRDYGSRSRDDNETPAPPRASPPAAANATFSPAPSYASTGHHQPAASNYQPAPNYHPAASAPTPVQPEPQPAVFRDSGGHTMEPAALRTHDEPRRQLVQHAVEQALLSGTTSAAVDSAFGMLTQKPPAQMPIGQMPIADSSRSIEDLVQDMLRPMLKHWLDDNLPSLVERLVRAEIERVSRGR